MTNDRITLAILKAWHDQPRRCWPAGDLLPDPKVMAEVATAAVVALFQTALVEGMMSRGDLAEIE